MEDTNKSASEQRRRRGKRGRKKRKRKKVWVASHFRGVASKKTRARVCNVNGITEIWSVFSGKDKKQCDNNSWLV